MSGHLKFTRTFVAGLNAFIAFGVTGRPQRIGEVYGASSALSGKYLLVSRPWDLLIKSKFAIQLDLIISSSINANESENNRTAWPLLILS